MKHANNFFCFLPFFIFFFFFIFSSSSSFFFLILLFASVSQLIFRFKNWPK